MEFNEEDVELYKTKKLIKFLKDCRGNGTSLITVIIPPNYQISLIQQQLTNEYGTAKNIKSKVNKDSVLDALTSAQQKLKFYNYAPPTGLCVFCGKIMTKDNKEKMINIDVIPPKELKYKDYKCDNKFHIEKLEELMGSSG